MPNLVGTGLNQVPTNSMLGGLAYQDPEHASIKNLDLKNLSQINSEIADTAVDVFVYDTRKDSDGGAWRNRTQNTSWYNETLNTSTRGSRKDFPAVAVIVSESNRVVIYDGDDPDLPMWMTVEPNGIIDWATTNTTRINISALNGILTTVTNDGGHLFKFVEDYVEIMYSSANYIINSSRTIAGRNNSTSYTTLSNAAVRVYKMVTYAMNDVAMTVLPNAPIDSATGLPVPTIAVATDRGTSVIKDDGTVVDFNDALGSTRPVSTVAIRGNDILHWNINNGTIQQFFDALSATADSTNDVKYNYTSSGGHATCENISALLRSAGDTPYHLAVRDSKSIAAGAQSGMSVFVDGSDRNFVANNHSIFDSRVAYITSNYNTGWMHGDIKGAFLSDTSSKIELITNGTFDSNTNGWTAYHSVASVDNNRLKIDDTANAGGWSSVVQEVSTVIGKTYQFTFTYTSSSDNFLAGHYAGSYASAGAGTQPTSYTDYGTTSGTYIRIITATTTTTSLVLSVNNAGVSFVDNVSFKLAEEDRSVNNNPLTVYGTVTKSAVATGAELVGYSGFSASNRLSSVHSDINFGSSGSATICFMSWVKQSTTGEYSYIISVQDGTANPVGIAVHTSTGNFYVYEGSEVKSSSTNIVDGNWHHCVGIISTNNVLGYVDGREVLNTTTSNPPNLSGIDRFNIGHFRSGTTNLYHQRGSLSLSRISKSIPSAEQIKKIYEDEKHLFNENAKATLYGSSDAVTALAYDDTTNLLHVGTSAGRSEFQGLCRINNTTDAVTTAISASNGLVAEQ
jgi:hypothetical protein